MTAKPVLAASEAGFTLAEVLVALAIVAAIGGALAGTVAQNGLARARSRDREAAILLAQSALDRAAAGDTSPDGEWQGLRWQVERSAYGIADPQAAAPLEELTVRVTGRDRAPLLTLATVRIRP